MRAPCLPHSSTVTLHMKPSNEWKESCTPICSIPLEPPVKSPYNPVDALDDIPGIRHALDLFLSSQMVESENYCKKNDEDKLSSIPFFLAYYSPEYLENDCISQQGMQCFNV